MATESAPEDDAVGGGRFFLDADALVETAFFLPALDLARVRSANTFCAATLTGARAVSWICGVRGLQLGGRCTCIEHVELAESLATLPMAIEFEFGSNELDEAACGDGLDRFAALLQRHTTLAVSVEGHCGLEAPSAFAEGFTRARAAAVVDALARRGVARARLHAVGHGNRRPRVARIGPGARENRRVELYVRAGDTEFPARPPTARVRGSSGSPFEASLRGESWDDDDDSDEYEEVIWDDGGDDERDGDPPRLITLVDRDGRRFNVPVYIARQFGLEVGFEDESDDDDDDDDDGDFRQPAVAFSDDEDDGEVSPREDGGDFEV